MPPGGAWPTAVAFLDEVTGDPAGVARRVALGEVRLGDGAAVGADTAYRPGGVVWLHRDLPVEVPVPGELTVLYRDRDLVVVDKPHFLATTPRGRHVAQTVVLRLRRDLDLPELSPAHRLDRLTAGVLLLTTRRESRAAYQVLFAQGRVRKEYEALDLATRREVTSRVVKERGSLQAREVPGPPNAVTRVELVEHRGGLGRYRLEPVTGRTHQLRVHLSSLGIPILGDPLYPKVRDVAADDFSEPLRLLAREVAFADPVSGEDRLFRSQRRLDWPARITP
jgi:tRNA pseudouridine32 synthase/23S rRNA pseudouridine746 synthase